MVEVNSQALDIAGVTLSRYLSDAGYDATRIAVECNGEIVPKANYEATILADGDCLEIVSFVGGG
ncbi:MAG: sulfur carrier protein ThiS [Lachnospiraceae bacterium]|nr:sulfur carrier protein ThiS [Lachnospiraceae bacterium]